MQWILVHTRKLLLTVLHYFKRPSLKLKQNFNVSTVGIVTDNERKMESMRRKLYQMDNSFVTYVCSSHLLNLLGQDVTPHQIINPIIGVSNIFEIILLLVLFFMNLESRYYETANPRSNKMEQSARVY